MDYKTPLSELKSRMKRFRELMDTSNPGWEFAAIFSKINLLYFTGCMPEGLLLIEKGGGQTLWVRRSYERTLDESLFENIKPMHSFKDAAAGINSFPEKVFLETEFLPLAMFARFKKHFPVKEAASLDYQLAMTRAVKSEWELDLMRQSGENHKRVLEDVVPTLLEEGMTEAELAGRLYKAMLDEGHHGVSRFNMFDTEMILGQIGFGNSSIYPTSFNGPGGHYGISPAVPELGSREKTLKKGDLVFIDIGMGVNGYHTDKTMTYMFGADLPAEVIDIHKECFDLQNQIAKMLVPGNIPSEIYESVINNLEPAFLENFMGYGNRQVKFLGHGIGLTVDELPVLAKGFDEPIQENMVFAIEPKKGIKDIGMVGVENTFVVSDNGGVCITGDNPGLIRV